MIKLLEFKFKTKNAYTLHNKILKIDRNIIHWWTDTNQNRVFYEYDDGEYPTIESIINASPGINWLLAHKFINMYHWNDGGKVAPPTINHLKNEGVTDERQN